MPTPGPGGYWFPAFAGMTPGLAGDQRTDRRGGREIARYRGASVNIEPHDRGDSLTAYIVNPETAAVYQDIQNQVQAAAGA